MKKFIILSVLSLVIISWISEEKQDLSSVLENYAKRSNSLEKLEFNVQRIDTFAQGGTVWNNKGYALIERDRNDKLFGFKFFAERLDWPEKFIYDGKNEFYINNKEKSYKLKEPNLGFYGSPGGQMLELLVKELFNLDPPYKSIQLIDTSANYHIRYEFEDDTTYDISNIVKIVELDKRTFLPVRIKKSYIMMGNRASHEILLSNFKINSAVKNTLDEKKQALLEYDLLVEENKDMSSELLNKPFPEINLPQLFDIESRFTLSKGKVTLIDFWEVWCGPCMKSLPEVEQLKTKYADKIDILGIVTDDITKAKDLINKKGITFRNLVGNKGILQSYQVNSFPRYFLIDQNGVIAKQYFGFEAEKIENDIKGLLGEF